MSCGNIRDHSDLRGKVQLSIAKEKSIGGVEGKPSPLVYKVAL